jgi:ABC-2 type transport system permease protein
MTSAAALTWFARHELRLAWREWLAMMTGGRRGRKRGAVIGLIVIAAIMHLPAYAVIGRFADLPAPLDKSTLIVITATIFLAWALMLSQAIESVTRVFYARADLDLIMSSPVPLADVFSVRIAAIALSVIAMALLLSTPFVDVLVIGGGIRWFSAYGVVIAIGLTAAAVAIVVTIVLFRLIGPNRTRLVAQILAATIGAGFVIALQIAAIMSYGTLSRFTVLTSGAAAAFAPDIGSIVWWPARAALGDGAALLPLLASGLILLGAVMAIFSPRFADTAISASANATPGRQGSRATGFRAGSQQQALRRKEFVLLRRDPWLISQTLMQLLYLVPPALLLWRSFADSSFGDRADHPCYRDGGRPTRRWPLLVDDIGRRRRRFGGDRTSAGVARDPRQDRSGVDRDRRDLRADDHRAAICLTAAGGGHRGRHHHRFRIGYRDPAVVSGAGEAQPVSPPSDLVAAGDIR